MIAISTAYKEAILGIEIDDKKSFKTLDSNCKHSENMLFTLDQMLNEMDKTIRDNDCFAVVIGPGSFTGLRIGISLLKGLMAGRDDKNIVPLTTFDLMAYSYIKSSKASQNFTCIINGLSGYYFICEYSATGEKLSKEKMVTKQELDLLGKTVGLAEEGCGQENVRPSGEELLALAKEKLACGHTISAKELTPLYLRKSQAESALEGKK